MIREARINAENLPPEIKEKAEELAKALVGILPGKCNDPHCPGCWGLADEEEQSPK